MDSQQCLMDRVRDVAAARDVQTGLKTEIQSLRAIIDGEESRHGNFLLICPSNLYFQ
jgi:hypothetical protein